MTVIVRNPVFGRQKRRHSNREIAAVVGVDDKTVRRDKSEANAAPSQENNNTINADKGHGAANAADAKPNKGAVTRKTRRSRGATSRRQTPVKQKPRTVGDVEIDLRMHRFVLQGGLDEVFPDLAARYRREVCELEAELSILKNVEGKLMNRNQRAAALEPIDTTPPGQDFWLRVRRQFTAGGKIYDPGNRVEPVTLGANLKVFISSQICEWTAPNIRPTGAPRDVPPPAPPIPNPPVTIIDDPDVVESWRKSLRAMTEAFNGDHGRARDSLLHSDAGGELYRRAAKVLADRESREKNLVGRRIVPAGI